MHLHSIKNIINPFINTFYKNMSMTTERCFPLDISSFRAVSVDV